MAGEIRLLKFRNKATTLRLYKVAEILIMILLIRCCEGVKKRVPYTNQDDLQRPLSHHHHGGISKKQVSKDFRSILPGCSDLKSLERDPRTPQVILISIRNFFGGILGHPVVNINDQAILQLIKDRCLDQTFSKPLQTNINL